jgi:arylsulfatase A-like enzyme
MFIPSRVCLSLFATAILAATELPIKPNIIVFYIDDLARNHIKALGGKQPTPHLDRLVREGIYFERGYVTTPICTPSRFGLLTGRQPARCAVLDRAREGGENSKGVTYRMPDDQVNIRWNTPLSAADTTIAEVLAPARSQALVTNLDVLPTCADLAGAPLPAGYEGDGVTLRPILAGSAASVRTQALLQCGFTAALVTDDQWKHVAVRVPEELRAKGPDGRVTTDGTPFPVGNGWNAFRLIAEAHPGYHDRDQLYRLSADCGEKRNLASDPAHAELLADLKRRLGDELRRLGRPFAELTATETVTP